MHEGETEQSSVFFSFWNADLIIRAQWTGSYKQLKHSVLRLSMSILFFKSAYGEILDKELHITDCFSSINKNVHIKGSSLQFIYTKNGAKDKQGMQQDGRATHG